MAVLLGDPSPQLQGAEDKARFHASGVWCSHTMWARLQRVLEDRVEKMESLRFDTVQLRSANHRAMEDNKMQSILTEQQLSTAQRECDVKVLFSQYTFCFASCRLCISHVNDTGSRARRMHRKLARSAGAERAGPCNPGEPPSTADCTGG